MESNWNVPKITRKGVLIPETGWCPYVYHMGWTHRDRWYIGRRTDKKCHPSEFWNSYKTSSKSVHQKFTPLNESTKWDEEGKGWGDPDHMEILAIFPPDANEVIECHSEHPCTKKAIKYECFLQHLLDVVNDERFLNNVNANYHGFSGPFSKETRLKMSLSTLGAKHSEETKKKMSESHKGIPKSKEARLNLSKSHIGRKQTKEHIENVKAALKKKPRDYTMTEEQRAKRDRLQAISQANPVCIGGIPFATVTGASKYFDVLINTIVRWLRNDEINAHYMEKKVVEVDGMIFPSVPKAAEHFGCKRGAINQWIKSDVRNARYIPPEEAYRLNDLTDLEKEKLKENFLRKTKEINDRNFMKLMKIREFAENQKIIIYDIKFTPIKNHLGH